MKFRNMAQKFGKKLTAATALTMGAVASAHATGATGPEAAFNALSAKATELEGYAWPVLTVIFVAIAAMGLFKKFGSKAVR